MSSSILANKLNEIVNVKDLITSLIPEIENSVYETLFKYFIIVFGWNVFMEISKKVIDVLG